MNKIVYGIIVCIFGAGIFAQNAFARHMCREGESYRSCFHASCPISDYLKLIPGYTDDCPSSEGGTAYIPPLPMPVSPDSSDGADQSYAVDFSSGSGYWPVSGCPYVSKPDESEIPNGCKIQKVMNGRCVVGYQTVDANGKLCQRSTENDIILHPEYPFNPFEPIYCPDIDRPTNPLCSYNLTKDGDGCLTISNIQCPDGSLSSNQFSVGSQLLSGGLLERIGNNLLNFLAPPQSVYPSPSPQNDRSIFSPPVENTIRIIDGVPYGTMSDGDRYSLDPSDPLYPLDMTNGGNDDESPSLEPWRPMSPEEARRAYEEKYKNSINKSSQSQSSGVGSYASGGGKAYRIHRETVNEDGSITEENLDPNTYFNAPDTAETFLEKILGGLVDLLRLPF